MKIGFDAKRAFHNSRGLGNYSREVIRLMNSFYPDNEYYLCNPKIGSKINYTPPTRCVEVYPSTIISRLIPSLWRSRGLIHDLKERNIDIYHGLSQELPYGIHKTKVKSVVTVHDAIFMRYPELYSPTYRSIFLKKNQYALAHSDVVIAISEQTKADIINYFGTEESKIKIVYQGCNNIFRSPISEQKKESVKLKYNLPNQYLLTVGAIERRKNGELIIKALSYQNIDIPLVIVGKPTKYILYLQELIHQLGLENRVMFLHEVLTDDLPAVYNMASVFVFPSLFEGFGIPILEAMCCGTPVICSSGTCFEEVGGSSSIYIDPSKHEELGIEIGSLLQDSNRLLDMKIQGKIFSERFNDQRVASDLMTVYNEL
jgi:glycosyltransferase involved in cell wall biosynthesis